MNKVCFEVEPTNNSHYDSSLHRTIEEAGEALVEALEHHMDEADPNVPFNMMVSITPRPISWLEDSGSYDSDYYDNFD